MTTTMNAFIHIHTTIFEQHLVLVVAPVVVGWWLSRKVDRIQVYVNGHLSRQEERVEELEAEVAELRKRGKK